MDDHIELRTRRPAGAVLSVRVPQEIAAAVDEYAAANHVSLSEAVRTALERLLSGAGVVQPGGVHGTTSAATMTITVTSGPVAQRTRSAAEALAVYSTQVPSQ